MLSRVAHWNFLMRVTVWFPVLRALKCWIFLSGIMFNEQREQHAQRPRGRARSQTGQGATDAGSGGRRAAGPGAGFYGEGGQGAAEAWEQVRDRSALCFGSSAGNTRKDGLNVGLAEGTVLKLSQNS